MKILTDTERDIKELILSIQVSGMKDPSEREVFLDQYATYLLSPRKYSKIVRSIEKETDLDKLNNFYETYF